MGYARLIGSGGGGGIRSALLTGTADKCLAGYTYGTHDSNDMPIEGTMPSGAAFGPTSVTGSSATINYNTSSSILELSKTVSITPSVTPGYISSGTAQNATVKLSASGVTIKSSATTTKLTASRTSESFGAKTYIAAAQIFSVDLYEGSVT